MSKAPAFQLYSADWLADEKVTIMSPTQEGAYIRAICFCWREGTIPTDLDKLRLLISKVGFPLHTDEDLRVVQGCFNQDPNDPTRMTHPRLEKERLKQAEWKNKSKIGGQHSAEKRKKEAELKGGSRVVQAARLNTSSSFASSSSFSSTDKSVGEGELRPRIDSKIEERAHRVLEIYPNKAKKDQRPVKKTKAAFMILCFKIAELPDYPWEEHAKLIRFEETPFNAEKWAESMPDEIALGSLRKAFSPSTPAKGRESVDEAIQADRRRAELEWEALPEEEKQRRVKLGEKYFSQVGV